ncbi:MAG: hypothetical protein AAFY11_09900 [Cyanobacteria bacterium J06641_5]
MGILQRLFGRDPNEKKEAYFLEPDDAKTYGDIDYMRKPQIIKRTFAKTVSGGGGEITQAITATDKREIEEPGSKAAPRSAASAASTAGSAWGGSTPIAKPAPAPAPAAEAPAAAPAAEAPAPAEAAPAPAPTPAPAPAPANDGLDFLSLARGIKKR